MLIEAENQCIIIRYSVAVAFCQSHLMCSFKWGVRRWQDGLVRLCHELHRQSVGRLVRPHPGSDGHMNNTGQQTIVTNEDKTACTCHKGRHTYLYNIDKGQHTYLYNIDIIED